jgi:hypothetical protein
VASIGYSARDEDGDEREHQWHQQRSDKHQLALWVTEIHGPPEAEALWDKQCRIVGIVVKEASNPVAIIIAVNGVGVLTIIGCVRFCSGTLRMPQQDEDKGKEKYTHQQDKEPHAHKIFLLQGKTMLRIKTFHNGKRLPPTIIK